MISINKKMLNYKKPNKMKLFRKIKLKQKKMLKYKKKLILHNNQKFL